MPASKTSPKLNVYLNDGNLITFIDRVDRRKAVFMSRTIREQLDNGPSLKTLINYINTYDTYGDWASQAFTTKHAKSEDLQTLLRVYRGLYVFQIKKAMAGSVFRQELLDRLHATPVSVKEFSAVYELTAFDGAIFTAMLHAFADFRIGGEEVKDAEAIEKYVYDIGFGKKLQGIEYFVKGQIEEAAEASKANEEEPAPAVQPVPVWVKPRKV
ncbi:hypothetical protein PRZ48_008872 [Zasmidium cellare]|uniref:Uncharacterized protein n=1 Tax=Zasmidium cellare TaxID=395010 RepID=A0ABR0EHS2_ZASCE|nr:hypothetical protein PRZ48_008872 [Zasmidium cellare]